MKYIFFLSLILTVFFSCKKKDADKMTISGLIYDPYQNIAVSDVTVDLYVKKIESGIWNASYTLIQNVKSDNSGKFSVSFDALIATDFKISFRKAGYFITEEVINSENVIKGYDYNRQYIFHSEAYFKLHIKNNTPSSDMDKIIFRIVQGGLNEYECCQDSFYTFTGKNVDVYKKCKLYGSQKIIFEWNIKNNTYPTIFYSDSIFCNSFDTTFYDINY